MNQQKLVARLLTWFAENARELPWRKTRDPYAIWVSEIMLQQTQVRTVVPYWERWMRTLPDIRALAKATPAKLHKLWEGLGYYTRVRNLHAAARLIVERHNGQFPDRFEDILELPGIGRYTAGAISSIAFNQPKPILDGNVIRVLARLFAISGNPHEPATNSTLWRLSEELVHLAATIDPVPLVHLDSSRITHHASRFRPDAARPTLQSPRRTFHVSRPTPPHPVSAFNQALMELGALVCTPRRPQCALCPVNSLCRARRENKVDRFPTPRRRPQPTRRHLAAFVVQRADRFLVRQRPAGIVNAHLWEFPNVELALNGSGLKQAARRALGFTPRNLARLFLIQHSITRHRISLEVFRAAPRGAKVSRNPGRWLPLAALRRLAFASAHKRILNHLRR